VGDTGDGLNGIGRGPSPEFCIDEAGEHHPVVGRDPSRSVIQSKSVNGGPEVLCKSFNYKSGLIATSMAVSALLLGPQPAYAENVDLHISDADNRTVTITATDLNDGNKKLVSDYKLKHNERWSGKMLLDKDNNGHVKFEAKAVDDKSCETRTYEGRQLPRGFDWQVSLKCN
jgi:hypothetical protein